MAVVLLSNLGDTFVCTFCILLLLLSHSFAINKDERLAEKGDLNDFAEFETEEDEDESDNAYEGALDNSDKKTVEQKTRKSNVDEDDEEVEVENGKFSELSKIGHGWLTVKNF